MSHHKHHHQQEEHLVLKLLYQAVISLQSIEENLEELKEHLLEDHEDECSLYEGEEEEDEDEDEDEDGEEEGSRYRQCRC